MMKKIFTLVGVSMLVLSSCGTSINSDKDGVSLKFPDTSIEQGFALNAQHCSKCHKLKVVKDYTREQWDKILPAMAKKAAISAEQEAKINAYINWELKR